jgi:hypothetical protein
MRQGCKKHQAVWKIAKKTIKTKTTTKIGPGPRLLMDLDHPRASEALD